jgi:uncharacterized damage-inducible protein DinB
MTDNSGTSTAEKFFRRDMTGSEFRLVLLNDAQFRNVDLHHVLMRGVELLDVDIDGEIQDVRINGVDVGPLIEQELNRRHPDRHLMHPTDVAGFQAAWAALERLWGETVSRARELDPDLLHESVDREWSFIQTLRHLVFATDSWLRRAVLGDPEPWHPLDLPWDTYTDLPEFIPNDRDARPSLDEVLALREDRMSTMRQVVAGLTDEQLAAEVEITTPGWPRPGTYPVQECLSVVVNEEWHHRLYAERDLAALSREA